MTDQPEPDFTSPIAGRIEVREPCPWCSDRPMIPRSQFDEHVMRLHPDVRTIEVPAAPSALTITAERRDQYAAAIRDRIKARTFPPGAGADATFGATEFDMADAAMAVADAEQAEYEETVVGSLNEINTSLQRENARLRHELEIMYGGAFDTAPSAPATPGLRERVASCPGYETSPNSCRCPCYGCKHHCSAHNPDDVLSAPTSNLRERAEAQQAEVIHGCPSDGSGLTPCCGRAPFELPLTDRISSEAPITCQRGTEAPQAEKSSSPQEG